MRRLSNRNLWKTFIQNISDTEKTWLFFDIGVMDSLLIGVPIWSKFPFSTLFPLKTLEEQCGMNDVPHRSYPLLSFSL